MLNLNSKQFLDNDITKKFNWLNLYSQIKQTFYVLLVCNSFNFKANFDFVVFFNVVGSIIMSFLIDILREYYQKFLAPK
jgi:uncharacterized membrane protein YjjP (DUF1212 family)